MGYFWGKSIRFWIDGEIEVIEGEGFSYVGVICFEFDG